MKVTLTHDGKSVELDLTAEQMTALGLKEEKKKTGYERVEYGRPYTIFDAAGKIFTFTDLHTNPDNKLYEAANYHTDEKLAEDNARADQLMRKLRRFAAENGGIPSVEDWNSPDEKVLWCGIAYSYETGHIYVSFHPARREFGGVYFRNSKDANEAIMAFYDELIWYFTEYEAMLR